MRDFELSRATRPGSLGGLDCYISEALVGPARRWGSHGLRSNSRIGRNAAHGRWRPEVGSAPRNRVTATEDERPGINSRCEEGLIRHTCEHITERYKKRTSASGHFRG